MSSISTPKLSYNQPPVAETMSLAASSLFRALFRDYFENHSAYLGIYRSEIRRPIAFSSLEEALVFVKGCSLDRVNTHYSVAPLKSRKRPAASKSALSHLMTVHIDIDCKSKPLQPVLHRLREEKPSAIVMSGNGFHVYFFIEPIPATPENIKKVELVNKALLNLFPLYGDPVAVDASHKLRVPGTFNVKDPNNPKLVELIDLDATRIYTIDELIERFKVELDEFGLEDSAGSGTRFSVVKGEDKDYLDRLLNSGLFEKSSRNRAKMLLTRYCWEKGSSKEQSKDFLNNWFERHHNGNSKDWLENPRACIAQNEAGVNDWFKRAGTKRRATTKLQLADEDTQFVLSLGRGKKDAEFLIDAMTHILNTHRDGVIFLGKNQLCEFANAHERNYREMCDLLIELGILELIAEGKKKERKAAEYRVLYTFHFGVESDGRQSISRRSKSKSDEIQQAILQGLSNQEIIESLGVYKQKINYYRRVLDKLYDEHSYITD